MKFQVLHYTLTLTLAFLMNPLNESAFASCANSSLSQGLYPAVGGKSQIIQKFGEESSMQRCGISSGVGYQALEIGLADSVLATGAGEVVYVGPLWIDALNAGRGKYAIIISHGDYYSVYSHNKAALVTTGQCVQKGQSIGIIGQEGAATVPMLYLEIVKKAVLSEGGVQFTGIWQWPFGYNPDIFCDAYLDPLIYMK